MIWQHRRPIGTMDQERLNYAAPDLPGRGSRTLGLWTVLLLAWMVGLIVWSVYGIVLAFILIRIL